MNNTLLGRGLKPVFLHRNHPLGPSPDTCPSLLTGSQNAIFIVYYGAMLRFSFFLALGLVALPGFTITRRADVADSLYRNAGELRGAVLRINLKDNTTGADDFRSGTLIGDKFVLTAAHNTPNANQTPIITIGGQNYSAAVWQRHPSFNFNDILNGYDVAVIRLDRRVLNVAPYEIYTASDEAGQFCELAGYGATGAGLVTNYDWLVRSGTNQVDLEPSLPRVLLADFDKPGDPSFNTLSSIGSSPTPTERESCIAAGDSGGPMLLQQDGKWKVAGVHSAVSSVDNTYDSSYGDRSVCSRVSSVASWITPRLWENGRIQVKFNYLGYRGPLSQIVVFTAIRNPGATTNLSSNNVPLAIDGGFSYTTPLRGTYDLAFQSPGYLRKVVRNITITNNDPAPMVLKLVAGDINGDNEVGPADYSLFVSAFGSAPGDANWNGIADFDGDGEVGPSDFTLLADGFGVQGDD